MKPKIVEWSFVKANDILKGLGIEYHVSDVFELATRLEIEEEILQGREGSEIEFDKSELDLDSEE